MWVNIVAEGQYNFLMFEKKGKKACVEETKVT
jgi:hypothetical protein